MCVLILLSVPLLEIVDISPQVSYFSASLHLVIFDWMSDIVKFILLG